MRWLLAVLALLIGMLPVAAPAAACACGGIVSPDARARIADEVALLARDGDTETIVMRLNLSSAADNAALVVPTPTPATVSAATPALFDELATLTAPRVETVRHWTFGTAGPSGEGARPGALGAGGPTVLKQVRLGPLEATTLAGGSLDGVRNWLQDNGYALKSGIIDGLQPYLRDGWSVVAMRLTGAAPLDGGLDPVRLTFTSDKLVYPMRMSALADTPQRVLIYTLGDHRMRRVDPDATGQQVDLDYAGVIATDALPRLPGHGPYLTALSTQIADPARITSDFEFADAPTDESYQRVIYRHEYADVTPWLLGGGALVVLLIGAGIVALRLLRRARY